MALANWANSLDEKGKVVTTKMKRNIELLFEIATSSEVSFSNDPVVTWSYFCFAGKKFVGVTRLRLETKKMVEAVSLSARYYR